MNTHVQPSTYERLVQAHKARRDRLFGRPKAVNILARPASPALAQTVEPAEIRFITPIDFIKARCAFYHVSYERMTAEGRAAAIVAIRKAIMMETHQRFPGLSLPSLGKLFKRTHTTVLYCLGHIPEKKTRMAVFYERDKRAYDLYNAGITLEAIADELEVCLATVKLIKRRRKWPDRPKPKTTRTERPHELQARELWSQGHSMAEIGRRLGMHKDSIRVMRIRWSWPEQKVGAA